MSLLQSQSPNYSDYVLEELETSYAARFYDSISHPWKNGVFMELVGKNLDSKWTDNLQEASTQGLNLPLMENCRKVRSKNQNKNARI